MKSLRYRPVFLLGLIALGVAAVWATSIRPAGAAGAAPERPLRLAVANVPRIISELREGIDFDEKYKVERQKLAAENVRRQEEIKNIQLQLGNFRPDNPQFEDLQRQYVKAYSEWKVWGETNTLDWELRKKRQIRVLHDKVYAAINEYAAREGIDLVLADVQANLTEQNWAQIPLEQVGGVLSQRRVLYSSKALDISEPIIALVDSKYRGQGAVGATGGAAGGGGAAGTGPGATDARPAGNSQAVQPNGNLPIPRRSTNR